MGLFSRKKNATEAGHELDEGRTSNHSTLTPGQDAPAGDAPSGLAFDHHTDDVEAVANNKNLDDSKVPLLTARTVVMAILAAMGGL